MPLPDHEQMPASSFIRPSQDELPTADSLFGDSGPFLSHSTSGRQPSAVANLPARPVRPPPQPATAQTQFRPVRPIRPMRPVVHPPHQPMQRPQQHQPHLPILTRPMPPPQNFNRPPRPQDQPRPYHQQQPQRQSPQQSTSQLSPQLSHQPRPRLQSPQMHSRPYSPQLLPRPPQVQRPPNHAFSPRLTAQNIQSPPQLRSGATHAAPTAPTVHAGPGVPIAVITAVAEEKQQHSLKSISKAQGAQDIQDTQQSLLKAKDSNHDASNLFTIEAASALDKDGLPSADVLFGGRPSLDFFRQPLAPIRYAPTQRPSIDTHRPTDQSSVRMQQDADVDLLFSPAAAVAATVTATIQHQGAQAEKLSPDPDAVTKILSPQPPSTEPFQFSGSQESQESQQSCPEETVVSAAAMTETTDAPSMQKDSPSNTVEGAHATPLSPTYPFSGILGNGANDLNVAQPAIVPKHVEATHLQDSSSLFSESDDMDASHFFSGPSALDSSTFFSGLSRPGPSALLPGLISSASITEGNDIFKSTNLPITSPTTDIEQSAETTGTNDSEPIPMSHGSIPFSAASLTDDAASLFEHASQRGFASSLSTDWPEQESSLTAAMMEAPSGKSLPSPFDKLEQSIAEPVIAKNDIQQTYISQTAASKSTEAQDCIGPLNNPHDYPAPLRESQRPPNSFKDVPSSQRHERSQVSSHVEHSPEHIRPVYDAHRMESFPQQLASDHQPGSHQHSHLKQLARPLESSDLAHQEHDSHGQQGQAAELFEESEKLHLQDHLQEDGYQSPFASVDQPPFASADQPPFASVDQPPHASPSITQEPQEHQNFVADSFGQEVQPFAGNTYTLQDRRESVSDLFDQPSQQFTLDKQELLDRRQSAVDFFSQVPKQRRADIQEPLMRKESDSYLLERPTPQLQSPDVQEPMDHRHQAAELFPQEPSSFAFDTQERKDPQGLPSAVIHGAPNPFSFDYQGSLPFDLNATSAMHEESLFETSGLQAHYPSKVSSWQSQKPVRDVSGTQALEPRKDLPIVQPTTFSFNNQFEDIDSDFAAPKQRPEYVDQSVAHQDQPEIPHPGLQDQPIPFDETLPSPASPGFGRHALGPFAAHDIHGAKAMVQPGSYSIMELSTELSHTAYFPQVRGSPMLQERISWSKVTPGTGASELSQGVSPKMEVETLAFDQVSLAEDAPGTNHSATTTKTATSPPTKERGLASLLDPSTLSAVEDLLNMPKSAAFERGMSRLFQGVKSSATSMFSSPLGQAQSKSLVALGATSAIQGQPQELTGTAIALTGESTAVPNTSIPNVSAPPITAPVPASAAPPPVADFLPPPPHRIQEKEVFKLPPPPRISHWPAASDTTTTPTLTETAPHSKFDWAHKQSNVFLEAAGNAASDPKDVAKTLSHIDSGLPLKHVDEVPIALAFQSASLPTPTALAVVLPTTTQASLHGDNEVHPRLQEGSAPHLPVTQGRCSSDGLFIPLAHISDGLLQPGMTESRPDQLIDQERPKERTQKKMGTSDASQTELELSSPTVPRHSDNPTAPHDATSPLLHHNAASPVLDPHAEILATHGQAASPTFQHNFASPTLLQRAISPSVLDPEVLLRKQAAIHALLADQVAHGGTAGAVRARPDKKERLLEKARELLEKRQQSSGVHLQGTNGAQAGLTTQKYSSNGSRSSSEWIPQDEIPRRRSVLGRDQFPSTTTSDPLLAQHHGPLVDPLPSPHTPSPPTFVSQYQHCHLEQQQQQQSVHNSTDYRLSLENERLKEQVRLLLAETTGLRIQVKAQILLQSQVSQLQEDLARARRESQAAEATQQGIQMDHSQRLNDISSENQRLQAALTRAQSEHHNTDTGLNELMAKYHQLEVDLDQSRQVCKEQEIALAEAQRMKGLVLENERLRDELDRSQKELQERRANIASDVSVRRTSMGLDGVVQTAEQLSQEAEGLRRQLKGQRQEMKELQDSVKRSDAEKRDLVSRIGQLERALADAEKHRNEQKSHQVMKDEAYKVIQERLVAAFEEEKAQYLDEEAFRTAKLEHQCSLLQDEVATLRAKDDQKSLSVGEELELRNRMTQLLLGLESARMSEREWKSKAEESVGLLENMKQSEAGMRVALVEMEDRARVLQGELTRVREEAASCIPAAGDAGAEHAAALESLSEELQLSLERERVLKKELELVSQDMKEGLVSAMHEGRSDRDDFDQSRLAESASRWQEECLTAKEETMRVEDQLQRANLELMAARTEIIQFEANLAADETSSDFTTGLQFELAELRERVVGLSSEIQARDTLLDNLKASRQHDQEEDAILQEDKEKYSTLEHQLEQQRSENIRLEKELLESKELLQGAHSTVATSFGPNQLDTLQTLLEEERRASRSRIESLEEKCEKTKRLMLNKQAEVEQVMIDLDSTLCRLSGMERELDLMKVEKAEEQNQRAALKDSLLQSTAHRNEEAMRQELLLEQSIAGQEALNQQISLLEGSRRSLELSLREHAALAETSKQEASTLRSLVEKLEQDLSTALAKCSAQEDEQLVGEKKNIFALQGEMSAKELELEQAKEQVSLIADLFRKLLSPMEDAEELEAREGMMSLLEGLELLGVSVQALPQVGVRFLSMEKEIRETKTRIEDLESQLESSRSHQQQQEAPPARAETKGILGTGTELSEVDRLRQELERAEHGIGKLQQFLQEFQNEKKRAIYELQQRLEESEEEVEQARSQLAKAQALLLSRPSGPVAAATMPSPDLALTVLDRMDSQDQAILRDATFKGTEAIHHEAILALEPLRQQKAELERTLLDLRHRYELSQKENDALLSVLERENKVLRSKIEMRSPDMSNEHLERIRELEQEQAELNRQLKTAQREREFTRQDMRSLKAELAKLRAR
ncbi:hypothetical protein BGW39_008611 [Mortierella sp. 14UC]|nr:hypothetical protein BGW39_008611 [Mortierella sp. 14UC]